MNPNPLDWIIGIALPKRILIVLGLEPIDCLVALILNHLHIGQLFLRGLHHLGIPLEHIFREIRELIEHPTSPLLHHQRIRLGKRFD